jgi:uncharacterized RDD family membrane protein YckC
MPAKSQGTSMEIWYYAFNGAQQGPITQEAIAQLIASGQLPIDSLVWREGMANWIPARSVPELAAAAPHAASLIESAGSTVVGYGLGDSTYTPQLASNAYVHYGGFWIRVLAAIIDWLVIGLPFVILEKALGIDTGFHFYLGRTPQPAVAPITGLSCFSGVFQVAVVWLYYALFESSGKMATLGKQACGLIVTSDTGQRMSFARATGRFFAKYISLLTLCIGYMLAGWTPKKQALHDMIASTVVTRK